jgi:hypothetical protein
VFSGYYQRQIIVRQCTNATGSTSLFWANSYINRVDCVATQLCAKSVDQIVFKESQLCCPRGIRHRNNKRCSLHRNWSTLCGNRIANEFGPPSKNASCDVSRGSTEMTDDAVEACMHRHRITG